MEKKIDNKTRLEMLSGAMTLVRGGWYICDALCHEIRMRGTNISNMDGKAVTRLALNHFPELRKHKPELVSLYNPYGWFGVKSNTSNMKTRKKVMESLIAEIAAQTEEAI